MNYRPSERLGKHTQLWKWEVKSWEKHQGSPAWEHTQQICISVHRVAALWSSELLRQQYDMFVFSSNILPDKRVSVPPEQTQARTRQGSHNVFTLYLCFTGHDACWKSSLSSYRNQVSLNLFLKLREFNFKFFKGTVWVLGAHPDSVYYLQFVCAIVRLQWIRSPLAGLRASSRGPLRQRCSQWLGLLLLLW